jgi:hypothetical protein
MVAFVGFSRVFLLGILIFKRLTARRLYRSFGVRGLSSVCNVFSLKKIQQSCTDLPIGGLETSVNNYIV